MGVRIGVDVGGTFTDLILHDEATGDVHVAKALTTPSALEEGVERVVSAVSLAGAREAGDAVSSRDDRGVERTARAKGSEGRAAHDSWVS